jgi:hypothetical protein
MKKSDYSFVLLSALLTSTSAFAQDPMFAAPSATTTDPVTITNPAITTTPMTTTNPTSNLFSASPAATISPVTTATPFATTTPVTTTSPVTTISSVTATSPMITTTPPVSTIRAFDVSITGIGPAVDVAAHDTVRQVIGHAVASGVIDKFIVLGYGVEGGFSACAEAAPAVQVESLNAVINQLNSIHPDPQTTAYSVQPVESCTTDATFCTQDAFQCPDGSSVGRVPPSCQFAPCPGTQ